MSAGGAAAAAAAAASAAAAAAEVSALAGDFVKVKVFVEDSLGEKLDKGEFSAGDYNKPMQTETYGAPGGGLKKYPCPLALLAAGVRLPRKECRTLFTSAGRLLAHVKGGDHAGLPVSWQVAYAVE